MRTLALLITLLLIKPAAAEELWACGGFLYSDESKGNPFVLRGDGQTYRYRDSVPLVIEYVAASAVRGFRIYVDAGRNNSRNAYYIREVDGRMIIRQHFWDGAPAETVCLRQ